MRNALLTAGAVIVVISDGGESAPAWWDRLGSTGRIGVTVGAAPGVVVLVEAMVLSHLLVRYGQLLGRVDELAAGSSNGPMFSDEPVDGGYGLAIGVEAPAFVLRGVHGHTQTLESRSDKTRTD